MERISQLMDGELGRREAKKAVTELESDQALVQSWETYHLIGDSLRREAQLRPDFIHRLHERLEQEPTVIAPHTRLSHRVVRYTLPLAATVAGVTLVAWLALDAGQPRGTVAAIRPQPPSVPTPSRAVSDYLTAHQEFSPSTAMQGLAPYVRTVSDDSNAR
jgi:sigma-E factor negative regulatory protein RseA